MEEALTSPTYPPAEAALALLAFLRDELPLGGTAAEARFLRLFPLLVSRIVGELNAADNYRHEPGGWLGRKERWSYGLRGGSVGGGGGSTSRGTSRARGGGGAAIGSAASGGSSSRRDSTYNLGLTPPSTPGSTVRRSGTPGSGAGGSSSLLSLDNDPVVQLLCGNPRDDGVGSGGGRSSGIRTRQPTLIDAVSDESVHRPGVRFSFDFRALPMPTQAAFVSLLLDGDNAAGTGVGAAIPPSPQIRPNAARLLTSVLRVPAAEQTDLRFNLQRQFQLAQQQRRSQSQQRAGSGLSPLGVAGGGGGGGGVCGAGQQQTHTSSAAIMLPLPADARAVVSLSMLEYYLIYFVRFAASGEASNTASQATSTGANTNGTPSRATNTMASGTPTNASRPSSSTSSASTPYNLGISSSNVSNRYGSYSSRNPYGEKVYLHLFRSYAKRYLPHSEPMMPPGHLLSAPSSSNARRMPRPPVRSFVELDQDAEFFLRLVLELWLDGTATVAAAPTTADAVRGLPNRGGTAGGGGMPFGVTMTPSAFLPGAAAHDIGLEMSFELADVAWGSAIQYAAPTTLVRRGTRVLVNHVVSDPAIGNAVAGEPAYTPQRRGVGGVIQLGTAAAASVVSSRTATRSGARDGSSMGGESSPRDGFVGGWCLTPAMTALQAPFYNYVRMNLRHAPVHVSDSAFWSAMNAWLVWLEPWNVTVRKNRPSASNLTSPTKAKKFLTDTVQSLGGHSSKFDTYTSSIVIPKATAPSTYTSAWEPYIAANLYLYTVPLAIFLRRARELDFSDKEFHRSLAHVQRIFRVFTPEVVQVVNHLLARQPGHNVLNEMVAQHERILGEFYPPSGREGLSLSSCSQDMHNVLEEIYLQHQKKVRELDIFDRIGQKFEGLFGQGTKGDELALERLLAQARVIVSLPADYEVLPGETKGERGGTGNLVSSKRDQQVRPERVHGGFLTETGRQQIVTGTRKCNAMDVAFLGDPMYSRVKSYEIPLLVTWTVWTSDRINERLGLVTQHEDGEYVSPSEISDTAALVLKLFKQGEERKKIWFRINLRFLADYRNLLCLAITWYIMKAIFKLFF